MNERRRPFAGFGASVLRGLSAVGEALNDEPIRSRVKEIDEEISNLKDERNYLISKLVTPLPGEKVSAGWDPRRYTPRTKPSNDGRLVDCAGRKGLEFDTEHPACPYRNRDHAPHDFMLRD